MFDLKYRIDLNGVSVGRVARDQDFCVPLGFYKNEYQIQYLFAGRRLYFVNGKGYTMECGCIALTDKKRIPKTCILGGRYHDRLLIELKGDAFIALGRLTGFDFERFFDKYYGVYDLNQVTEAEAILQKLETEALCKGPMQETAVKTAVLELLCLIPALEEKRVSSAETKEIEASAAKQIRVHHVADYISKNYNKIESVEQLAETFYISKSYLCRIFKEVINFTISEYINLHRIEAARQYLLDEKYSVTEIANLLGYSSLAYFEKTFKKEMSVTPLQYKKMKKTVVERKNT